MSMTIHGELVVGCRTSRCIDRHSGRSLEELRQEGVEESARYLEFRKAFLDWKDRKEEFTGQRGFFSGDFMKFQRDSSFDGYEDDDPDSFLEEIPEPLFLGYLFCECDTYDPPFWCSVPLERILTASREIQALFNRLDFDCIPELLIMEGAV